MSKEAMKLALEAMERYQVKRQDFDRFADEITALQKALAEQPAQQEPVANHYANGGHLVYPTAQRPWVGLTDEEAFQICVDCGCLSEDWLTLLDAIEAKLKEKNT